MLDHQSQKIVFRSQLRFAPVMFDCTGPMTASARPNVDIGRSWLYGAMWVLQSWSTVTVVAVQNPPKMQTLCICSGENLTGRTETRTVGSQRPPELPEHQKATGPRAACAGGPGVQRSWATYASWIWLK